MNRKSELYILSQLALKHHKIYMRYFGISLLFDLYIKKEDEIEKIHNRDYPNYLDLFKITGENDVFNVVNYSPMEQELAKLKGSRFWKIWTRWQKIKTFMVSIQNNFFDPKKSKK